MPLAVLISTYELGRQPFGLASPAAWLRRAGAEVICNDTAVQPFDEAAVARADLIGFYLPMHTATRLAAPLIARARALNPAATIVCYGLYGPMNQAHLRGLGADAVIGGEFEAALVEIYSDGGRWTGDGSSSHRRRLAEASVPPSTGHRLPSIRLERLSFIAPERADLPPPSAYATLVLGGQPRVTGYSEASRGCKHTCRHCPVVPIYGGKFRVVAREVVLEDIRRQVAAGAQHITFGDPDFLNGPGHAIPLVQALHAEHPELTYDVTVKVEHLLAHAALLPTLRATGCALITSAFEAFDEGILERFDKRHSRAEAAQAVALCREHGLALNPTFVAFTPWTSRAVYADFLRTIAELGLVEAVSPIQYAIRLLVPQGSLLLELGEMRALLDPFDQQALYYPWRHPDPTMDALQYQVQTLAEGVAERGETRQQLFARIWALATNDAPPPLEHLLPQPPIPYMSEPWYC
jgi:radical SAM superfamily enzyme YgiQ (UPF0313 family)